MKKTLYKAIPYLFGIIASIFFLTYGQIPISKQG